MNLHALKVFGVVAQYESMTRAAEHLFISQPAVTKHVRNLEEEFGFPLVEMQGRGVKLTAQGEEVARLAMRLRGVENDVQRYARQYRRGELGELKVGATYLPANYILPGELAAWKKKYPDVAVQLWTLNAEQALQKLQHCEIDIAVIGGRKVSASGIRAVTIKNDEIWFVVPPGDALAGQHVKLGEMLKAPIVMREEGSSLREMLLSLCRTHGFGPPKAGMFVNGSQEALRMIAAGYGAGFVSAMEAGEWEQRGEVKRVYVEEAAGLRNEVTLCVREEDELPPAASIFYYRLTGLQRV